MSSVQSLSHIQLFVIPKAHQASLSISKSWSLLKLMCMESVMPCNHLILCHAFLLPPSIFPSIRVFSSESFLRIRWPNYWNFGFSISPSNEYSGLISFRIDWISLQSKGLSRVFSNTTVQKHQFFSAQLSLWSNSFFLWNQSLFFRKVLGLQKNGEDPTESSHMPCTQFPPGANILHYNNMSLLAEVLALLRFL